MRTIVRLLLLLVFFLPNVVLSQESPRYDTPKFDRSISHRTDLCSRHKLLFNGTIDQVKNALRGLELSVITHDYTGTGEDALFRLDSNGRIPIGYPGLYAILMDELAKRAGFTWRNSFGAVKPLDSTTDGNNTWTNLLKWGVDTFDISVDYWSKSAERINRGISFPEGWYDGSIILVERVTKSGNGSSGGFFVWNFLQPFDLWVWILIVVSIIVTGLIYWFLENLNNDADARNLTDKPLSSVFLSAIVFTTHFEFRPNTTPAMLLAWSWTFWSLITAAAYTANLASFLVGRNEPHTFFMSLDQVVRLNRPICVLRFTNQDEYITDKYPTAKIVRLELQRDLFNAFQRGKCDVAVTQRSTFDIVERSFALNGDCSLKSYGRTERIVSGGFATALDTGSYCTSLISHVLDLHLINMKAEGFIDGAWNDYLKRTTDQQCQAIQDAEKDSDQGNSSSRLDISDMGGIFVFHYILCAVAFILAFMEYFREKRRIRKLEEAQCDDDGGEIFDNSLTNEDRFEQDVTQGVHEDELQMRHSIWDSGHMMVRRPIRRNAAKHDVSMSLWTKPIIRRRSVQKDRTRPENMRSTSDPTLTTNRPSSLSTISEQRDCDNT